MDGAAARGRLKLVKWLDTSRSEGCSAAAFNGAAANNHLGVYRWLWKWHRGQCNLTEALASAAGAGHLKFVKYLQTQNFFGDYAAALEAAAMNKQLKMVEHLLTENWVQVNRALAVAAKNGLTEVMRILLRSFRRFNETALHRSHALEHAAAAGHVGVLALLLEHCSTVDEDWSAEFTTPALMEAAMAGQTDAVVMLLPRCKAFTVSKALAIAVFFEHEDMVESLLGSCPPTEMVPALVAATDNDSLELFERVFVKCAPYGGLSFHEKESFCSCFISAASRGCEEIVKLLVSGLVLSSEYPAQKAIRLVLEDAAASSKYELMRIILDAFTSAKLRLSFAVVSPAFKKAHARNDQEMLELLTKYCR